MRSPGSLTPCLYKFPDHGLSSGSCALGHGFSSLTSAFLSADEAPGGPGVGEVKADIQGKNARDAEDAPAMDSPQIRELEMFANDFKIRRIKLGELSPRLSGGKRGITQSYSQSLSVLCSAGRLHADQRRRSSRCGARLRVQPNHHLPLWKSSAEL